MVKKQKICFVIPNYITSLVGGAELQVYLISKELLERGWEIEVLSSYAPGGAKINLPQYQDDRVKQFFYEKSKIISFEFFRVFFKLFKTNSTYYFQRTDYPLTGALALFCKLRRRKMIYWLADDNCAIKNHYSKYFNAKEYNSHIKVWIRKMDWFIVDKMIEYGKRNSHFIVSQTQFQRDQVLKNFKLKSAIIRNSYKFDQVAQIPKENIILWVGNFRKTKRPQLFTEIAQKVKINGWRFVMVGNSLDYFTEVKDLKIDNFEYMGPQSMEQTIEWFIKSKIYISTSVLEGFSNTFIQAWYYRSFILSLSFDPDCLITNRQLGIYALNDLNKLTDFLVHYCSNEHEIEPFVSRAYEFVRSEFDIKKNTDTFIDYISQN